MWSMNARWVFGCSAGTPAHSNRTLSLVQLSGRNRRKLAIAGTSRRASATPTSDNWRLAQSRGVLRPNADRMRPLLRQCRVVDHQDRVRAADQPVGLDGKRPLLRRLIPQPVGDETTKLIAIARRHPLSHRANALAIARCDQPGHIERAHPPPRLMAEFGQKRPQPIRKLRPPVRHASGYANQSAKPHPTLVDKSLIRQSSASGSNPTLDARA